MSWVLCNPQGVKQDYNEAATPRRGHDAPQSRKEEGKCAALEPSRHKGGHVYGRWRHAGVAGRSGVCGGQGTHRQSERRGTAT